MKKPSAGILLYRHSPSGIEFLLVHPGGPFWQNKELHAWSIPKGEMEEIGETGELEKAEIAARREFLEETGQIFEGTLTPLPPVKTVGGKIIHAFLGEGDFDTAQLKSNLFEMEWPPKSGRMQSFPEVDEAEWFATAKSMEKIHKGQVGILKAAVLLLSTE